MLLSGEADVRGSASDAEAEHGEHQQSHELPEEPSDIAHRGTRKFHSA